MSPNASTDLELSTKLTHTNILKWQSCLKKSMYVSVLAWDEQALICMNVNEAGAPSSICFNEKVLLAQICFKDSRLSLS